MMQKKLLAPMQFGTGKISNRIVMAPMNRRRAKEGIPGPVMIEYCRQRAGAGLIISDNLAIAANGGAYLNTPGIYTSLQVKEWKKITDAVHSEGGKIFAQLVHSGRVGHTKIQNGEPLIAPSALSVREQIRLPDGNYEYMSTPHELKEREVYQWINAFTKAAANAMEAGFDGVEIHAAHGFLIDQFSNPHSNLRKGSFGEKLENRNDFLLEVMREVIDEIGKGKVGIRLSPFRYLYDLKPYAEETTAYFHIIDQLQMLDILYIHFSSALVDQKSSIPKSFLQQARSRFKNAIMIAGGFTPESAEIMLQSNLVDLIAFGKLFISNPDLTERVRQNAPLAQWDENTFYQGDADGYITYSTLAQSCGNAVK